MSMGRAQARAAIEGCLERARSGDINGAQRALDALAEDKELMFSGELGPLTVIGLPRKLHSANLKLAKIAQDRLRTISLQYTLVPDPVIMAQIASFDGTQRRIIAQLASEKVPRLLHQVWIGDLPLPPAITAWRTHCKLHDLEYRVWTAKELAAEGFDGHPAFSQMMARRDYPGAADVARYLVLERFGGLYMDADWYPARDDVSFNDFLGLTGLTAFAAEIPRLTSVGGLLLANAFIATPPGHPAIKRVIEFIPHVMSELPDAPAWWSTGPLIFTYAACGAGVTLAPTDMLCAVLKRRAPFEEVEAARSKALKSDYGFIIDWKSW